MRVYANLRIKRYKEGIPACIDSSPTRGKLYATLSAEEIRSASEEEARGKKRYNEWLSKRYGDKKGWENCKTVIAIAQRNSVVIYGESHGTPSDERFSAAQKLRSVM